MRLNSTADNHIQPSLAKLQEFAEKKEIVGLRQLLESPSINVDEFIENSDLSVAGEFARQGNKEAADFLRLYAGANINFICYGAARGGDQAYANELVNIHGASITYLIRGFAAGGYLKEARDLIHGFNGLNQHWDNAYYGKALGLGQKSFMATPSQLFFSSLDSKLFYTNSSVVLPRINEEVGGGTIDWSKALVDKESVPLFYYEVEMLSQMPSRFKDYFAIEKERVSIEKSYNYLLLRSMLTANHLNGDNPTDEDYTALEYLNHFNYPPSVAKSKLGNRAVVKGLGLGGHQNLPKFGGEKNEDYRAYLLTGEHFLFVINKHSMYSKLFDYLVSDIKTLTPMHQLHILSFISSKTMREKLLKGLPSILLVDGTKLKSTQVDKIADYLKNNLGFDEALKKSGIVLFSEEKKPFPKNEEVLVHVAARP
jgi:hypothetical protein